MPGISVVYSLKADLTNVKTAIYQSLDSTLHYPWYFREILQDTDHYVIGCVRYQAYPVVTFECHPYTVYLEGRIYNKDCATLQREFNQVSDAVFEQESSEWLTQWLLHTDGDFVVLMVHQPTRQMAILNDVLGRLPLYYAELDDRVLVARDQRFITQLLPPQQFDRMAIAQHLLIGFTLGSRTLVERVHRLQPGTLIKLTPGHMTRNNLHTFNFETKADFYRKSAHDNAHELISLFGQGSKSRGDDAHANVLSMSGGLDARSVGAAFAKLGIPFVGATFLDFNKQAQSDVSIARELADVLGIEWTLFELGPICGRDALKLLRLKSGLSPLGLSLLLPFLEAIREKWGANIVYFTGDGGDKTLPDLRPPRHLKNLDSLVRFIISRHSFFSLEDAAALTGISSHQIVDEMQSCFASYPEATAEQKYIHFYIYERAVNWLFEGEDRNRCYFWSATPFYSLPFFTYAMNCPDEQKAHRELYRLFLHGLSPELAAVNDQNVGVPIASRQYRVKTQLKSWGIGLLAASPTLARRAKRIIGRATIYPSDAVILSCLQKQTRKERAVSEVFSYSAVQSALQQPVRYSKAALQLLLTVTSAIEDLSEGQSTLENYLDSEVL